MFRNTPCSERTHGRVASSERSVSLYLSIGGASADVILFSSLLYSCLSFFAKQVVVWS